jgi:hypothetical protein
MLHFIKELGHVTPIHRAHEAIRAGHKQEM